MLVLLSQSPQRQQLLRQIGFAADVHLPARVDETPLLREPPQRLVARLARAKLETGRGLFISSSNADAQINDDNNNTEQIPQVTSSASGATVGTVFLSCDTVVAVGRRIIDTPSTPQEARSGLQFLSGRGHCVYSAVCVAVASGAPKIKLVRTRVKFKRLDHREVDYLVDSEQWIGRAGGYAIQGAAAGLILGINGSYSSVVGLPLYETQMLLNSVGMYAESKDISSL